MSPKETTIEDIGFMRAVLVSNGVGTVWETQTLTLADLEELYKDVLREIATEEER